ncbi:MAG: hypothetical protein FWG70_11460 [Oscillospiraceae bacterium]|nr:hypothetical protein [Oscillospiraceae bacterium]
MKMKKTVVLFTTITIVAAILFLSACSSSGFTKEERFAARANITLSARIGDFPGLEDVVSYVFTTIEYYEEDGAGVIRADCSVRKSNESSEEFSRYVFLLSDKLSYLESFVTDKPVDIFLDEFRELYYMNLGDYVFTAEPKNFVDKESINKLSDDYHKTRDGSIIGLE